MQDGDETRRSFEQPALPLGVGGAALFGEYGCGRFLADQQQAADAPLCPRLIDRVEAVGPVGVFKAAVPDDRDQLVLVPGRSVARHHMLDLGTDDGPCFRPALSSRLPERAGVPVWDQ